MKYRNASNQTIRLNENSFLQPGVEIELSEDDLKNPEVVKMKNWDWLIPIAENVIGDVIKPKIIESKPRKNAKKTNNEDAAVATYTQAVEDAIKRASLQKPDTKTWNPMDDAAPEGEEDYLGAPKSVDTARQYGSGEIEYDFNTRPITHMGGSDNDDPSDNPTGRAAYIPHHPEDLAQFNTPAPEPPKPRLRKEK